MQHDDLTLDAHRYDVTVLASPLEYLAFLGRSGRAPGEGGWFGLEALLQGDLEHRLEAQALEVHRVGTQRIFDVACTCGLVMPTSDGLLAAAGHRDLRRWGPVGSAYVVSHEPAPGDERFGVVCPSCSWSQSAPDYSAARGAQQTHQCRQPTSGLTAHELRLALGLSLGLSLGPSGGPS